jgi:hypothetical protein
MAGSAGNRLFYGISVFGALCLAGFGASSFLFAQFATTDYVSQSRFWPTQTKYVREEFAGTEACANCHLAIVREQRQTSMARTAMRAGDADILKGNPQLSFTHGSYQYAIQIAGNESVYAVSDGRQSQSAPLVWAFGTNRVAQSYLFKKKKDGEFHEARVTYFLSLSALDFTPGRALDSAQDVDDAMDREVSRAEVSRCFSCHTTASGTGASFDEAKLMPGVGCEACHGPARGHVDEIEGVPVESSAVVLHQQNEPLKVFNPKTLTPEESVDFCGSCHGSYWDVNLSGSTGVGNARFQPYRLEQSKCWNKDDARLTCVACHDPHTEVDTDDGDYDHVCLSCHVLKPTKASVKLKPAALEGDPVTQEQTHPGPACPVARKNCTSCHMPRVYVPAMHYSFPDHRIRIVQDGEGFPD